MSSKRKTKCCSEPTSNHHPEMNIILRNKTTLSEKEQATKLCEKLQRLYLLKSAHFLNWIRGAHRDAQKSILEPLQQLRAQERLRSCSAYQEGVLALYSVLHSTAYRTIADDIFYCLSQATAMVDMEAKSITSSRQNESFPLMAQSLYLLYTRRFDEVLKQQCFQIWLQYVKQQQQLRKTVQGLITSQNSLNTASQTVDEVWKNLQSSIATNVLQFTSEFRQEAKQILANISLISNTDDVTNVNTVVADVDRINFS